MGTHSPEALETGGHCGRNTVVQNNEYIGSDVWKGNREMRHDKIKEEHLGVLKLFHREQPGS
jgi:hypothetical protein